jgi:urease accessory protein
MQPADGPGQRPPPGLGSATEAPTAGWQAHLRLGFEVRGDRTVLARGERRGPLTLQRPFQPGDGVCHAYLLHPPGGIVGGDSLTVEVAAGPSSRVLITTPVAAKLYRSAGAEARQTQHLTLAPAAALEWLPQEAIVFPGAKVRIETRIALAAGARLAWWEINCLGRPAIGEPFARGAVDASLVIDRAGRTVLRDRLRVSPERLRRRALLAGFPVSGTLVMAPAAAPALATCRDLLPTAVDDPVGATLLDDLLVVRMLGRTTADVRRVFEAVWQGLRPTLLGAAATAPRIWAT